MSERKRSVLQPRVVSPRGSAVKRPPMLQLVKGRLPESSLTSPDTENKLPSFNVSGADHHCLQLEKLTSFDNLNVPLLKRPSLQELHAERKLKIAHYGRKIGSPKAVPEVRLHEPPYEAPVKKRCGWITSQSDDLQKLYHDFEWGVPVHNDRLLFELLTLASAQSEMSWSAILQKRQSYRDAFSGFDPAMVAAYGSLKLVETRLRIDIFQQEGRIESVVENAVKVLQVAKEFGSFHQYMWGFVNHKPVVTGFKMSSKVPVKTSRAEVISKDLMVRGFKNVAPAVVYSFMQASGMTNDHTVHCYRYKELNLALL